MKVTRSELNRLIRESMQEGSAKMQARHLLDKEYEVVSDKTEYPYGRYRGDVKRVIVYSRKDGKPVPSSDIDLLKQRDLQVRQEGGPMPALAGLYNSSATRDGMSIRVVYTRHTSG